MEKAARRFFLGAIVLWLGSVLVSANPDAKRLYEDVMAKRDYNRLIRPVSNYTQTLVVYIGLKLAQLIDIDEKNQIMTTNVWVKKVWKEPRLGWNPKEYGGIMQLRIPASDLWLPDVVLFNNADGNYEANKDAKALLHSSGMVMWEPPAIFKSSCQIDVEFFPFDKQRCAMMFGSWTYDGLQVDVRHISQTDDSSPVVDYGIDLDEMHESTEWDVLHVPARRNQKVYPCCPEPYPDITFTIVLRRKTLFYTVNLIFPCVAISFLSLFVFYLPSDSGEKTTLCISILLAVTFFFLVLAESIPPTSLVVPLIGKYLLFTMVLVTFSIIITVIEMNFNMRKPSTNKMSHWTRKIFLEILPKLLLIKRPHNSRYDVLKTYGIREGTNEHLTPTAEAAGLASAHGGISDNVSWRLLQAAGGQREWRHFSREHLVAATQSEEPTAQFSAAEADANSREAVLKRRLVRDLRMLLREEDAPQGPSDYSALSEQAQLLEEDNTWKLRSDFVDAVSKAQFKGDPAKDPKIQQEIRGAIDGVQFMAKQMRSEVVDRQKIDDWKFITHVMDRLFLLMFSTACIFATFGMFLQAPSLYDTAQPIDVRNVTFVQRISID